MKKIMMMLAAAMLGMVALTGCGPSEAQIEKQSQELVEKIYKQLGADVKCTKVKITKKIDSKHYEATATVTSEGESQEVNITIELQDKKIIVKLAGE